MSLLVPTILAAVLAGVGIYGVLARRNAVMVLIGAELIVNGAVLVLVLTDVRRVEEGAGALLAGQVGALFAITIAAAEIGLALAVVLLVFRAQGSVDLASIEAPPADPAACDSATGGREG